MEASGGGTNASATNYPVVQVMRLDSEQVQWLPAHPMQNFDDSSFNSSTDALQGFPDGQLLVTVFVNGVAGAARMTVLAPDDPLFGDGFDNP